MSTSISPTVGWLVVDISYLAYSDCQYCYAICMGFWQQYEQQEEFLHRISDYGGDRDCVAYRILWNSGCNDQCILSDELLRTVDDFAFLSKSANPKSRGFLDFT